MSSALVQSGLVPTQVLNAIRQDGWMNILTGLGDPMRDKRLATRPSFATRLSQPVLDELYHSDDIIARVCDRPADEMTRQGFKISNDLDANVASDVLGVADDLDVMDHCADAISQSRLHGGSIIVLGIEDGLDPSEPVDLDRINALTWMNVLDRWEVQIERVYTNPREGKLGEPQLYRVVSSIVGPDGESFGTRIHESRVIRFDGVRTARRERHRNAYWARSYVERIYEVVRDFASGFQGAAALLQDFSQATLTIDGLGTMVAEDQDETVMRRLKVLDMCRSVLRLIPLDTGESFNRQATPVAGLGDILDRMAARLSAATDMPISLLMGQAPAGLQATGDSDIRFWYDQLKGLQKRMLRKPITKIVRYIMRSKSGPTGGQEPDAWSIDFNPLWQPTEAEKADTRQKQANVDNIYIQAQVLQPSEVRQSRFGGDAWSAETVIDSAYDTAADAMDEASDVLAAGGDPGAET